jgi:tetratricopeptide (TPR) repeat protein
MSTARVTAGAILLLVTGCGTLQGPRSQDRTLPPQDVAQSQAWAHYAHGLLLEAEKGRGTPAALQAFQNARACDPDSRQPAEAVALNLLEQERGDEALAVLAERCRRLPKSLDAHLALARTAELAGDYDLAARHYDAAFDLNPDALTLAFGRIRCLFKARRDRASIRAMQRLHRQHPGDETRHAPVQWAAYFLQSEKTPLRALPCLELAADWATNDTSRAVYLAILASATARAGQTNAAQRAFQRALAVDSRCDPALQGLGALLAARGDTNVIARQAASAPQRTDPLPDFLVAAYAYEIIGARTQVVSVLTAARDTLQRRRLPVPEKLFLQLGAALDELDRDDEAAAVFQEGLAAFPQAHTIMNYLAYMWAVDNTHLEEASRLVQNALAHDPANAAYLDTLGWVRYRQGRHAEALPLLMQALRIMGDDPIVLDHVGDALAALDRTPEAVAYWSRSFVLDTDQPELAAKLRRHGVDPAVLPRAEPQPAANEADEAFD